jgi:hypothetical protein
MNVTINKEKSSVKNIVSCCSGMAEIICRNTITFVSLKNDEIKMLQPNKHYVGGLIDINALPSTFFNSINPIPGQLNQLPQPFAPGQPMQPFVPSPINWEAGEAELSPEITMEFCPKCGAKINITIE